MMVDKHINDELKDTEKVQLSDIFEVITRKNRKLEESLVLTNSAVYGIMSQKDFFDDAKITTGENLDKYTIIEKGDFVYNPRKSVTAPYGPINLNEYAKGVISPLYFCFKVKQNYECKINKQYMHQFFQSNAWYKYVYSNGDTGTRYDRVSISNNTFMKMSINLHNFEDQNKIVHLLSSIDDLIENSDDLIKNILDYKNYLICQVITDSKDIDKKIKNISDILYIPAKEEAYNTDTTKILRLGLYTKGLTTLADDNSLLAGGTKYYHRKAGDFIFGKQNIFNGSVGIIPDKYNDYLSSGDVPTLRFKDRNESDFFLHFISRREFYNNLEIFANGSGSKRVHEKDLLNIKIKYPNNRKNITKLLNNLDSLIKLYNLENENYKLLKRHYLNIIFK